MPAFSGVIVYGKKKKGPGGAAAQALEALEALEAAEAMEVAHQSTTVTTVEPADGPKHKGPKKGKKGKKGPAATALAALEAIEAAEAANTADPTTTTPSGGGGGGGSSKTNAKKGKNKAKGPAAAALAALEELEALEAQNGDTGAFVDTDTGADEAAVLLGDDTEGETRNNKKKGKKKGKKQGAQDAFEGVEVEPPPSAAAAATTLNSPPPTPTPEPHIADSPPSVVAESLEQRARKERPAARVQIAESSQPGHVSLRLDKISMIYKDQEVLKDASWEVSTGQRVGLVGANGCGKTTQIKILAGDLEATSGDIVKSSKSVRTAILRQEFTDELVPARTLKAELGSVFMEANAALERIAEAEGRLAEIAEQGDAGDADAMQQVLDELAEHQGEAERLGAYSLDSKVEKVIDTMGFLPEEAGAPVSSFSGGWKMRIGLGKLLLQDPNVLLLDEPTNHLDLESVEWLEEFLIQQNIPMVIVSHDREFLDRVCTKIVDTEGGVTTQYDGNYSRFLKLKKARMDAWESAYQSQQKKIKEDRNWINQNKNKPAASSQVKQRQNKLDKLLKGNGQEELVQRPPRDTRKFRFRFPKPPRVGVDELAVIEGFTHGYNGRTLFDDIDLVVESSDRIAFLGPNGAGKSTLLRCLVGKEPPQQGTCELGSNVVCNYFEQNQADAMDLEDTVIGVIEKASTTQPYEELRALLGQFLFKGDDVNKQIKQLSGGEKARVALCRMMLTPANLLVLDEPTNHLDIPAKEMLEEALQHYEGSMLLISHDRYFISQVATTIVAIEDKKLELYSGDYRFYMDNRPEVREKVRARYVDGDRREIVNAKVVEPVPEEGKRKKTFGGGGGPSGKKDKGVKNAKRQR